MGVGGGGVDTALVVVLDGGVGIEEKAPVENQLSLGRKPTPLHQVPVHADQFIGHRQSVVDVHKASIAVVLHVACRAQHRQKDDLGTEALPVCLQIGGQLDLIVVGHRQLEGGAGDIGRVDILVFKALQIVLQQNAFAVLGYQPTVLVAPTDDLGQQADLAAPQLSSILVLQHDIVLGENSRKLTPARRIVAYAHPELIQGSILLGG